MRFILSILFSICLCIGSHAQMIPTFQENIPMRDGKTLAADVYVPTACTSCPTILIQTPYNKNLFRWGLPMGFLQNLQSSPYNWVIADWRGFYGSVAATIAQPNRGEDGYDVMEWITNQSWSNGKIGTWGSSALGGVQYSTAKEQHVNHTCAVPLVAHPQQSYDSYFYGGVLEKSRLEQLDALGYGLSTIILANTYYNLTWQYSENTTWYPQYIQIPTLQIGGWYDHNIDKMMDWYEATRTSASIAVKDQQWLLVGPWVHGGTGVANVGSSIQGELTYPNAEKKSDSMALDFFAHYLLGASNNWTATPMITYYELGNDQWNSTNASSIESGSTEEWLLNENNQLSNQLGNGSSSFVSDPKNPTPTLGGATLSDALDQGPYDQISIENRNDLTTFTTGDLTSSIGISGRVKLNLYVEADQPDVDIAVRLVDVYPDGRNILINDGIKRMRFRNGYAQTDEVFMTTGQVYNVDVDLPFVNYTWKSGHELKVYISGNNATRWDVNLQNGGAMYTAGDTNVANIQIHHSTQYPSKIILPVNDPLGIKEKRDVIHDIIVFPNPAKGVVRFEMASIPDQISLLDAQGKKVYTKKINASIFIIDVQHLESGIYFYHIISGDKRHTGKLIIQK